MNRMIQLKQTTPVFLVALLLCFWVLQGVQAVVPPPDGGYPGGNTAEGQKAVLNLTTGTFNSALGFLSLSALTTGNFCTGVGAGALLLNTADGNTAVGAAALLSNTTGSNNAANGFGALFSNTGGNDNTAIGLNALNSNTTGNFNTASGAGALINNTIGNNNTALGVVAGSGVTTASNVIAVGSDGANVSNSCFIGNIRGVTTVNADAIPVLIDSAGQLGTASSSAKFKKEIKPMDKASEAILALKPVTFHYKSDKRDTPQFGLIAEEVAKVNPDLVVRDKNGEIYTVRYDAVNAMLLNEFLKEHQAFLKQQRKIEVQDATIAQLKSTVAKQEATTAQEQRQIEALTAGLQKVSAPLEASKPAPQVVNNP
jgi:uncharacterized coiled-coil protein SlyX